jgi:hypothetical protein
MLNGLNKGYDAHPIIIAFISGETVQCTLCIVFPSGLPEGSIVFKGFCWEDS